MDANMSEGYKIIVRFFKEIGLYNEFKDYCDAHKYSGENFNVNTDNPLRSFGGTSVSYWIESNKGIRTLYGNLFDHFKAWLYIFYPDLYYYQDAPSSRMLDRIDKDKKTIKIEYEYRKTNNAK